MKKKMLITGASRSIGAAIAERFKSRYDVVTIARSGNVTERGDLTDMNFLRCVMERHPELDVLVNNAGCFADFMKTSLLNYVVPGILMEYYVPKMNGGHIINITSNSAHGAAAYPKGYSQLSARHIWYISSKNAIKTLSEHLARHSPNVKITSIEPAKINKDVPMSVIPDTIDWILSLPCQVNSINLT